MTRYRPLTLVVGVILSLFLSIPINSALSWAGDPSSQPSSTTYRVSESASASPAQSPVEPIAPAEPTQGTVQESSDVPELPDLFKEPSGSRTPLINRDTSKDAGQFLPGSYVDQEAVQAGFESGSKHLRIVSVVTGHLLAFLIASLIIFNILGLIYIQVPPVRGFLDGGMSAAARAGGGPARGGTGRMGAAVEDRANAAGAMTGIQWVPTSAIQAVAFAEAGVGSQGDGRRAIRPLPYYFKSRFIDIILLGAAIILLVLSSVAFDTGLNLGNAAAAIIYNLMSMVFPT